MTLGSDTLTPILQAMANPRGRSALPFSFTYGGTPSATLLPGWKVSERQAVVGARRTATLTWTDPDTGLRLTWEATRFTDFPAAEWVLYCENTGKADTPIIADMNALDVTLAAPLNAGGDYRLYRTNGAPANSTDFAPSMVALGTGREAVLGGGGGRSSNRDMPFFKLECQTGSYIVAVGWSGQWEARITGEDNGRLHVRAGLERTHFRLHPGERVRSPRMLLLHASGDTWESNALFRQLIHRHYAAPRAGKAPPPTLFCNTCFTRGGGWLNECNAENQISLIRAYSPLGLEALITDAGWFEGGWPAGAGNWTPRRDAYPEGMKPVAAAAKEAGMVYGLWFEPERVVAETGLHREHPGWLLSDGSDNPQTYLADFGRPEVRDYFLRIVKGFMALPGFRVYRQDFNMDPLPYWRHTDAPDRQGITEMKYIEGLYAFWDSIAKAWPDGLREECASGGRRIDLETIRRMHLHQATDYWFDDIANQGRAWGLSQYLPNGVISEPINRLDDVSFHSTLAASLCLGWIADAPDFDRARARYLADRYRAVRDCLNGAWYPLRPYSLKPSDWMASQYHRPDQGDGIVLVYRRPECRGRTLDVALRGLDPETRYEAASDATGLTTYHTGAELSRSFRVTLPEGHESDLIAYRKSRKPGTSGH